MVKGLGEAMQKRVSNKAVRVNPVELATVPIGQNDGIKDVCGYEHPNIPPVHDVVQQHYQVISKEHVPFTGPVSDQYHLRPPVDVVNPDPNEMKIQF